MYLINKKNELFRLVLTLIIFIQMLTGCKKSWFDIKSDSALTVPSTLEDFEYLLDNFTLMNYSTPGLGEIASDGHYLPESRWQLLSNTNQNNAQKNAYTWTNDFPYNNVQDWNEAYQKIAICNLILDGLPKIKLSDGVQQDQFNRIKGNALFHRAKNYYDLAQIYAQPYRESTANVDVGIPLKEGIDITEPAVRASVKTTYDQIIKDLEQAANLLPKIPQLLSRGSKVAAFALLARTYLVMANYQKSGAYADSCLNGYDLLIDYNTIPISSRNLGRFNAETIFYSQLATWPMTFSSGLVYIDSNLYKTYGNNDLRKSVFFSHRPTGEIVFEGMYNSSIAQFSGLATDEVYLIRAECYARIGDITNAMKTLNILLKMRWNSNTPYIPITANTSEEALLKILEERRKELLLRGIRWSDLKRLNQDDRFKTILTRSIGGQLFTLEPGSYKYTFPIPDDVLASAPQIMQSPDWVK